MSMFWDEEHESRPSLFQKMMKAVRRQPTKPAVTHDMSRPQPCVLHSHNEGRQLTLMIFSIRWYTYHPGDYLILTHPDRSTETTRYRITATRHPNDPGDQLFIDCTFDPRSAVPTAATHFEAS